MSSSKFAEKIRELEREGQSLLADCEVPSSIAAAVSAVVDGLPSRKAVVKQKVAEDSQLDRSRVEESLNRSIRSASVPPPSSTAQYNYSTPSTTPGISDYNLPGWISPPKSLSSSLLYQRTHPSTTPPALVSALSTLPTSYLPLSTQRGRPAEPSLSQSLSLTDRLAQERQLRQASVTVDQLHEQLRQAQKVSEEQRRQFRASNEELNRRLQDAVLDRDKLAASRVTEASSQDELISTLQNAVTELHRVSDSQKSTIDETEKQVEILQLVKSDHYNMMELLRSVLRTSERRRGRSFYDSEPVDRQSSAMLVHSLERCLDEQDQEREVYVLRVEELERELSELSKATLEIERVTTKSHDEKYQRMRGDLEDRLAAADERANNSKQQSDSLKQQLDMVTEQYRGSELLREEQNKMLEERVEMLKSQLDAQNRDSQSKLESVSLAMDNTHRDLTNALSTKDELVRRYAGLEEKVKDYEITIEKLNSEIDSEREQSKRLWEKDNDILNRNVEVETKIALRDAEMARLEALLEKTKDECTKQVTQEVALAEKYQQEKHAEEKSILVNQVDSLSQRHSKASKDLQETQVENAGLLSQLKHALDKLSELETEHTSSSEDKQTLQSQLITKNELLDKTICERDQYIHMIEQRNNQLNELSLSCERANMQRDEKERHCITLESTVTKLEERLAQAHKELNNYQQETCALHRTRDEFDGRIREMEAAVDKQTRKLKSKDKKLEALLDVIADADSEKQRLEELVSHKTDTVLQLEEQLRNSNTDIKDCRREMSMLTEECNALKSVMKGQEGEMQREINNLLIKLKAVEHDYKLSKKALKSKEHVDKQATDMANTLQAELTDQRKHADDLRTKIRWLEDSLEMSKKDKHGITEQCEQLQVELEHRCQSEQRQQQILGTERSKTSMLQSKVVSLEDGLKEAISRCSSLQASAEKSEQNMYKLKLKHQLEMKELQRSTQENQSTALSLVPPSPPKHQDDGLASELKTVLTDMRSLLSTAQERRMYHKRSHSDNSNYTEVSEAPSEMSTYRSKGSARRSDRKSTSVTESIDGLLKPTPRAESERSASSAANSHRYRYDNRDVHRHRDEDRENRAPREHRTKHHKPPVSEPLKSEAEVLCQNLERKLEKLTKIGQQVTGDSRDSANFVGKKRTTPTSYEKLHRYLRSQKS